MANPRKFSEKIALLNQKEAEGNAAYDAIMKEVNATTKAVQQQQKVQRQVTTTSHFYLAQPQIGTYRGGSLPNVNQMSNNSVDLQSALDSLQTMKQATGRPSLMMERIQKERGRQLQAIKRPPFDKRTDCSPYGSAYLSPPPDGSWRRVNSDSAIHSNTIGPTVSIFPVNNVNVAQKVVDIVPLQHSITIDASQLWELRKRGIEEQLRSKSGELPEISIFPSLEPDTGVNIPIPSSSGSLPDLTSVQFPTPLTTPLDGDEQSWSQLAAATGQTDILSQALLQQQHEHVGALRANSPSSRRRHTQGSSTPLIIHGNLVQMRQGVLPQSQQVDVPSSTGNMHPYAVTNVNAASIYNGMPISQHQQHAAPSLSTSPHHSTGLPGSAAVQYRTCQSMPDCPQSPTPPPLSTQTSYSPSESPVTAQLLSTQMSLDARLHQLQQQQTQTSDLQQQFELFNMLQESNGFVNSTSAAQPQYMQQNSVSGVIQPSTPFNGIVSLANVNLSDAALIALACNMDFVTMSNGGAVGGLRSGQYSTADSNSAGGAMPQAQQLPTQQIRLSSQTSMQGLSLNDQLSLLAAQQLQQQQQAQYTAVMPSNMHVPDIILTGADESLGRADQTRDAGGTLPDLFYDLFNGDEAFKVSLDPLDLDSLQMLTDPSLVTDTETEDSFRLDRL